MIDIKDPKKFILSLITLSVALGITFAIYTFFQNNRSINKNGYEIVYNKEEDKYYINYNDENVSPEVIEQAEEELKKKLGEEYEEKKGLDSNELLFDNNWEEDFAIEEGIDDEFREKNETERLIEEENSKNPNIGD